MSTPASLLGTKRDDVSRGNPAVHDHVCGLYETREEQYEPACRFLKAGLERKQQCLYITEQQTPAQFMSFLDTQGLNVTEATENGSLKVLSGEEVRGQLGGFTPEAMFSFLTQSEHRAQASGFTAFRWGAEMTWLRKDNVDPVEMFRFEAELNRFLLEHELVGLCQYAMADFRPELLVGAVETHPLLVYNNIVCDNFYYVPPDEYFNPQFADRKLKRILYNIITRERLMQKFLSDLV